MPFQLRRLKGGQDPYWNADHHRWEIWGHLTYRLEVRPELEADWLATLPADVFLHLGERDGTLNFKNYVGLASLGGVKVLVQSRTLDLYEPMLIDLTRAIAQLPFAFNTPTSLPYDPEPNASSSPLLHRWLQLRNWMEGTVDGETLESDLRRVLFDPHRRLAAEWVDHEIDRVADVSAATLLGLVARPDALVRLPGDSALAHTPLARQLAGWTRQSLFPDRVRVRRNYVEADTPENRFVKYALCVAEDLNQVFYERVAFPDNCVNRGLAESCERYDRLLAELLAEPFFLEVGSFSAMPPQSMVLQRREGYRGVLRGYTLLQSGLSYPVEDTDLRRVLANKDIATLYEYWCFFEVASGVSALLGPASQAVVTNESDVATGLSQRTVLNWATATGEVTLAYNQTFVGRQPKASYSVNLRPDITLTVAARRYVFDAKFKLDGLGWEDNEPKYERASAKREDLYKMHTYREAIANVAAAFVLYPGPQSGLVTYADPAADDGAVSGVGAIPLRPADVTARGALAGVLARIFASPD